MSNDTAGQPKLLLRQLEKRGEMHVLSVILTSVIEKLIL